MGGYPFSQGPCIICRYAIEALHRPVHIVEGNRPVASRKKRIPPQTIAADRSTFLALQNLDGYTSQNSNHSLPTIQQHEMALAQAEQNTIRARAAFEAAREAENELAHAFHDAVIGARQQVIAQYGSDGTAVEVIGLKRKSNYKRASRRKAAV